METIPSFLFGPGQSFAGDPSYLNNTLLRIGEVQEIVQPSDPRSRSKKVREYRVFVQERGNGTGSTKMYEGCILMNLFGGFADKLEYTLRAEKNADTKSSTHKPGEPGKGSQVLILCINGEAHSGVIIGGLRVAAKDKDDPKGADGHHLNFEFNGVHFAIDKDGAMTLTVKGATDALGATPNTKLPSTINVSKEGTITAATNKGKNSIVLEQSGKCTVTTESEVTVNTKKAKIKADHAIVDAPKIELGGEGLGSSPANGMVHGTGIDTLTGSPYFMLGSTSKTVFGKK